MKDVQRQTAQINLRLTPRDLEELDAVASELALTRSSTLRFLVREKMRAIARAAHARVLDPKRRSARA